MPSGLPSALSVKAISRNFSRAVHVVAATCLIGAVVIVLGFQADRPELTLWPAIIGLAPIGLGLYLVDRFPTTLFSIVYLVTGAVSVYVFTLVFAGEVGPSILGRAITVELPEIAVIMVGSTGAGSLCGLRWSSAGFATAAVAASVARFQLDLPFHISGITVGAYAVVALLLMLAYLNRRRASVTRPQFVSAAEEELVSLLRYRIETRAAALMHDTVLSHLTAIAATPSSTLPPALIERMTHDLEILTAADWLEQSTVVTDSTDWRESPFGGAVHEAEALGLGVGVTGEISSVMRLDSERATALGLAVKQCLVNVINHSGAADAELAVYGADDEILVMVVDTGSGFDVDALAADRLGVRTSIVNRIESVGGTAQVWSTPGRGTSVVLRLPVADVRLQQSTAGGIAS